MKAPRLAVHGSALPVGRDSALVGGDAAYVMAGPVGLC